jgi:hypothetical protein
MTASTRRRFSGLTDLCALRTRDTVPTDTEAAMAISRMVGFLINSYSS